MAQELIRLVQKVFSNPDLPPRVLAQKSRIFCKAHHDAASYCGRDHLAAFRHHVKGLAYHPLWSARIAGKVILHKTAPWYGRLYYGSKARFYHYRAAIYYGIKARFYHNRSAIYRKLVLRFLAGLCSLCHQALFVIWSLFCKAGRSRDRSDFRECRAKKFAFLSHVLPPSWSGQAVVIRRLLEGIEAGSYCLLSSHNDSAKRDFIGRLPGSYHALPLEFQFRRGMRLPGVFRLSTMLGVIGRGRNIANLLRDQKCAALVVGTGNLIDLPAACLAAALSGVAFYPYLFDDFGYQWADPVYRQMALRFEPVLFKNAAGVIVPNEFLKKEIQERHEVDATIVRNCCEGAPLEVESTLAEKKGRETIAIAYTGAVYHVNFGAFRNLIAALDSPLLAEVSLHLYTAQPEDFLKQEGICGPRVVQHAHVPPSEVAREQRAADVLFIPFSFDCTVPEIVRTSAPGKFGDYLASGTPILAHVPGDSFVCWYLRKYDCGIVVDQDDPTVLGEAILRLMHDDNLRSTLSRNAQDRARIDFSPEVARQNFLSAIGFK